MHVEDGSLTVPKEGDWFHPEAKALATCRGHVAEDVIEHVRVGFVGGQILIRRILISAPRRRSVHQDHDGRILRSPGTVLNLVVSAVSGACEVDGRGKRSDG